MIKYEKFLSAKPLFYKEIDYDRMPSIWKKIKQYVKLPKIIHVIGTNGKGTTGRYLANLLKKQDLIIAHYSSPHILKFNERIWINGENASDKALENAHKFLLSILDKNDLKALSYFEYTTLLAMKLFEKCDFAILEAGMGGEYDATAVFDNILTLVTPIDYDHQEFLGETIKKIAQTKLNSIQKCAIVGKQHFQEVYNIAEQLSKTKYFKLYRFEELLDDKDKRYIDNFANFHNLPIFLRDNFSLALSAYKYLGFSIDKLDFEIPVIMGRCQKIAKNITIDVGHNVLAANALKKYFGNKKVILVYNSYKDKDYKQILQILKPIIKRVEILKVRNNRIEDEETLKESIIKTGLEAGNFVKIEDEEDYLVFGSFSVVEEFLRNFFEK